MSKSNIHTKNVRWVTKKTVEFNFSYSAQLNVMLSAAVSNIVNGIIKTDFMFYTF